MSTPTLHYTKTKYFNKIKCGIETNKKKIFVSRKPKNMKEAGDRPMLKARAIISCSSSILEALYKPMTMKIACMTHNMVKTRVISHLPVVPDDF